MGTIISIMLCSLLFHEVNGEEITTRQTDTVTKEMEEKILNNDYSVAKKALDDNKEQKSVKAIQMSLKNRFLDIRKQAADAIKELNDKPSIPALIEALEDNYQARYSGGLEMESRKSLLNKSLLSALEMLTGLTLPEGHELSPAQAALQPIIGSNAEGHELSVAQIKEVIQEFKRWWNENKDTIK
jgi:hypothetical protein